MTLAQRAPREFAALFRQYTIRTVKSAVKAELTIPQQTRYLVPIELGNVERHVYDQSFEQALEELGLDARGVAASEAWEVDTGLLRTWLRKLRGIATHPQVGQLLQGKEGEKLGKGVLKTMAEVLEGMCEANWRNTMDERKKKVDGAVRYAQLNQHCEANARRYHLGLEVLLQAEKDAQAIADELQAAIAAHDVKGEELKRQAGALREARAQLLPPPEAGSSLDKGKGKARDGEQTPSSRGSEAPDGEAAVLEGLPKTPAGEAHRSKCQALSARIREARLTLHRVKFLQGDVYHVLGESHAKDEDAAYKSADTIRRDLLKVTEDGALRAMAQLRLTNRKESLTKDELIITVPFFGKGGVRSSDLMDEGDEMIEELLNEQSELLWEWREKLSTLLTEPLTGGDETTGQEYNHTLDTQGEAETYLQAYAHLLADRKEAFSSERTTLAAHEGRDKFVRKTKRAQQAAAADDTVLLESELELQPEHQVLQKELALKRKALREDFDGRALKSIMVDLSSVLARITRDTDPERKIVKDAVANVRRLLVQQEALTTKLEADVAQFRRAFNERILYFRQLQEISDSVVDVEWEGDLNDAIVSALQEERDAETNAKAGKARQRYLDNLAQDQESGDRDEDDAACILCRCDFTRGYITQCAHIFCEGCMKAWLQRKEGKVCPVCRVSVNPADLQRFSVGETEVAQPPPKPIAGSNEVVPRSRRRIEYNFIDKKLLEDINTVESMGSYGSKIQTLVRHLLHVQLQDPGAKSIVFSAWADSLYILQHALTHNGIPCLRIDQSRGKESAAKRFREDPGILVLLLHGERENAGLNVTCASRVFLLESVVNHAFEIQAIARIDRMGQTRPTEVFCYYAEDTVEKNILDLAARQGLSLYTADNAAGTLSVTPFASDVEKKKVEGSPAKKTKERAQKGDFVFSVDDILAIFFPHMYEDLEYLVPMEVEEESGGTGTHGHAPVQENAIAGPSRLHT